MSSLTIIYKTLDVLYENPQLNAIFLYIIHKFNKSKDFSLALTPHTQTHKKTQTKQKLPKTTCCLEMTPSIKARIWCTSDPVPANHYAISKHSANFLTSFSITWQICCFYPLSLCKEQITFIIRVKKLPSNSKTKGFKNVVAIWIAFSSPMCACIELTFYRYSGCIIK